MKQEKYRFRFFIEWGGMFLWPDSSHPATLEKFDIGPRDPEELHVSKELCEELHRLEDEYQDALDWEYPPNLSPWGEEQFKDFFKRLRVAYEKLCDELKDNYDITYCMLEKPW